jgi:hypothetical protein
VCPDAGFWSRETCKRLRDKIGRIIAGFDLDEARSIFSTKEQSRKSDDYFLGSGDKIRFFWEVGGGSCFYPPWSPRPNPRLDVGNPMSRSTPSMRRGSSSRIASSASTK